MSSDGTFTLEDRRLPPMDSGRCPVYVRRTPPCKDACPSSEDIRGYLTMVSQGELFGRALEESLDEAWQLLADKNPFPAVIGRICPHPCESACNRRRRDWPLAIHDMERFIGDHGIRRGLGLRRLTDEVRAETVAVIGAGPAGLSCAYQLARRGYRVTVYEAAGAAGGMLRTGIPAYRLPRDVLDAEVSRITGLGVEIRYDVAVGADITLAGLRDEHDAVYAAVGAHQGIAPGLPGDDLPGVLQAHEFLGRVNSGALNALSGEVLVIGGGNAAVDAARAALRLGAGATIAYRRSRFEMPAIPAEVAGAESEGVRLELQAAPVAITAAGNGRPALTVDLVRTEPGPPDASGRSRPLPVDGAGFSLPADTVVTALGQETDLTGMEGLAGDDGSVKVSPQFETALPGVFAGGDMLAPGLATTAIGQGRQAARAIDAFLRGEEPRRPFAHPPVGPLEIRLDYYPIEPLNAPDAAAVALRVKDFREVNQPLSQEEAVAESSRCMSCGRCFACDRCRVYCPWEAISRDMGRPVGFNMFTDYAKCSGCSICSMACPCGYIRMDFGA